MISILWPVAKVILYDQHKKWKYHFYYFSLFQIKTWTFLYHRLDKASAISFYECEIAEQKGSIWYTWYSTRLLHQIITYIFLRCLRFLHVWVKIKCTVWTFAYLYSCTISVLLFRSVSSSHCNSHQRNIFYFKEKINT